MDYRIIQDPRSNKELYFQVSARDSLRFYSEYGGDGLVEVPKTKGRLLRELYYRAYGGTIFIFSVHYSPLRHPYYVLYLRNKQWEVQSRSITDIEGSSLYRLEIGGPKQDQIAILTSNYLFLCNQQTLRTFRVSRDNIILSNATLTFQDDHVTLTDQNNREKMYYFEETDQEKLEKELELTTSTGSGSLVDTVCSIVSDTTRLLSR